MRILILTNNYSGLYNFRKEVVKAIKDNGHEVYISAPIDEKTSYFEEIGCIIIDTQFNRKGTNPIKDTFLIIFYCKIIKRIKPDAVLSYTIKPNIYGGIACQVGRVSQIVNITGLGTAVENSGWLQRLSILLYKVGLRKAKTVFFQNKANMDFCVYNKMVKDHMVLIPGSGVNLQYHTFHDYPADGPIKFVFISRLLKEKGIEEYFGAAKKIKELYPDTEFHILGDCEEAYEVILDELQYKGIVIYHGPQPDVRPYIRSVHCMVHPSYYPEGMSNVLLESCAAGRPIITTNRPGCGEILDDGRNGYVVKEKNVEDLTSAIERFILLPYNLKVQMGMNARKKVEHEFDRQIVVDAYLKEIKKIRD